MVEKVEVVVSVRSRRLNDVDWIVVELWMKRPCVEPRPKGLAEQDDDDESGASCVLEGCEKMDTALLSRRADLDLDERDLRRRLEWCV